MVGSKVTDKNPKQARMILSREIFQIRKTPRWFENIVKSDSRESSINILHTIIKILVKTRSLESNQTKNKE